ncbi:MAG: hypothetical protein Q8R79_09270 [Legionellaceae bacterium]|nr:hypothetical protein [Legionellaceae bacterium]
MNTVHRNGLNIRVAFISTSQNSSLKVARSHKKIISLKKHLKNLKDQLTKCYTKIIFKYPTSKTMIHPENHLSMKKNASDKI